jgi:hypothetical protein
MATVSAMEAFSHSSLVETSTTGAGEKGNNHENHYHKRREYRGLAVMTEPPYK